MTFTRRTVSIRKAIACAMVATCITFFAALSIQTALSKSAAITTASTKAIVAAKTATAQTTPAYTAPSTSQSSSPSAVTTRQS